MGRECKTCGKTFHTTDKKGRSTGRQCGACQYDSRWMRNIELKYGISQEDYIQLRVKQKDCCAICGIHESKLDRRLYTDHCHTTGIVRGLLCHRCNTSIGQFETNPDLLIVAYNYLKGDG